MGVDASTAPSVAITRPEARRWGLSLPRRLPEPTARLSGAPNVAASRALLKKYVGTGHLPPSRSAAFSQVGSNQRGTDQQDRQTVAGHSLMPYSAGHPGAAFETDSSEGGSVASLPPSPVSEDRSQRGRPTWAASEQPMVTPAVLVRTRRSCPSGPRLVRKRHFEVQRRKPPPDAAVLRIVPALIRDAFEGLAHDGPEGVDTSPRPREPQGRIVTGLEVIKVARNRPRVDRSPAP